MGHNPEDYDLATSATPAEMLALFGNSAADTGGRRFGTVTVTIDHMAVEVTTYRSESGYSDNRRPDVVRFEQDITADLSRRDFTVNAMSYHPVSGLYDPFGGADDINKRVLKTVGKPQKRFSEDALRVYRLFRFAARLGFSIDPAALRAARKVIPLLATLPPERIAKEMLLTLAQRDSKPLAYAVNHGFYALAGLHRLPRGELLGKLPDNLPLRLAALCRLAGTELETLCKNLLCGNALTGLAAAYAALLSLPLPQTAYDMKKGWQTLPPGHWPDLLDARALLFGESVDSVRLLLRDVLERKEPWNRSMLMLSGDELLQLGIRGRQIGLTIDFLLDEVLKNPEQNQPEILREHALTYIQNLFSS